MFAKEIGELGGSRHSCHIRLGISQHPLAAFVIVLNSGGNIAQQDHIPGVVRQLLWGEKVVDQGRAVASQPEKRLGWVTAWAAVLIGVALPFFPIGKTFIRWKERKKTAPKVNLDLNLHNAHVQDVYRRLQAGNISFKTNAFKALALAFILVYTFFDSSFSEFRSRATPLPALKTPGSVAMAKK